MIDFSVQPEALRLTGKATTAILKEGGIYSDATLTVLNSKNIAKTEIRFQNIYPTSLGGLNYDIKNTDVNYIQASVSFALYTL